MEKYTLNSKEDVRKLMFELLNNEEFFSYLAENRIDPKSLYFRDGTLNGGFYSALCIDIGDDTHEIIPGPTHIFHNICNELVGTSLPIAACEGISVFISYFTSNFKDKKGV